MINDWTVAADRQRELIDDANRIARARRFDAESRTRRWWQW